MEGGICTLFGLSLFIVLRVLFCFFSYHKNRYARYEGGLTCLACYIDVKAVLAIYLQIDCDSVT